MNGALAATYELPAIDLSLREEITAPFMQVLTNSRVKPGSQAEENLKKLLQIAREISLETSKDLEKEARVPMGKAQAFTHLTYCSAICGRKAFKQQCISDCQQFKGFKKLQMINPNGNVAKTASLKEIHDVLKKAK